MLNTVLGSDEEVRSRFDGVSKVRDFERTAGSITSRGPALPRAEHGAESAKARNIARRSLSRVRTETLRLISHRQQIRFMKKLLGLQRRQTVPLAI